MKKRIWISLFVLSVFLLLGAVPMQAAPDATIAAIDQSLSPKAEELQGDINGDGVVNLQDVLLAYQHLSEKATLTAEQVRMGDVTYDGDADGITMQDVLLLYRYFRGLIDTFPSPLPESTTLPGGDTSELVGVWSSGPFTPIDNSNLWVEFKADGTFTEYVANYGVPLPGLDVGEIRTTGYFRVEGDKIHCSNVKQTYKTITGSGSRDYTDRPTDDFVWVYQFVYNDWPSRFDPQYPHLLCLLLSEEGRDSLYDNMYYKLGQEQSEPEPVTASWTGNWQSGGGGWGVFAFTENGNAVTGKCDLGSFSGTISENTLLGICGSFELLLTMSSDGNRFKTQFRGIGESYWFTSYDAVRMP